MLWTVSLWVKSFFLIGGEGCCVSVPCGCALVAASVHVVDINAARCWE